MSVVLSTIAQRATLEARREKLDLSGRSWSVIASDGGSDPLGWDCFVTFGYQPVPSNDRSSKSFLALLLRAACCVLRSAFCVLLSGIFSYCILTVNNRAQTRLAAMSRGPLTTNRSPTSMVLPTTLATSASRASVRGA